MSDSDKKVKHFILSRFFSFQRRGYPYDVLDVDFLKKQLPLAKNMLRSLENQTNKNFELLFMANPKFFEDPRYEFIFTTLRDSSLLPFKFMKGSGGLLTAKLNSELVSLLKETLNEHEFVITTRMDFDDFIFKDAVADTQSKVVECEDILAYGYNKGYTYIYGELYPRKCTWWKDTGHDSMFQSLIVKSSAVEHLPCFSVEDFEHPCIKPQLKAFLEKKGFAFTENMFQQNSSDNAYIYFRHDFSQEQCAVHGGKPFNVSNLKPLTNKDITKEQLKSEFGFECELKLIK